MTWKVLSERGIPVRGPAPDELGLDPEPDRLHAWNLAQLHWRQFAERARSANPPRKPLIPAHRVATTRVLGAPRLHYTIATDEVISKEAAGEYALDTFPARWHLLIHTALAGRRVHPRADRRRGSLGGQGNRYGQRQVKGEYLAACML